MDLYEDPDGLLVEGEVILLVVHRQTDHVVAALEAAPRLPRPRVCKVVSVTIISDISTISLMLGSTLC